MYVLSILIGKMYFIGLKCTSPGGILPCSWGPLPLPLDRLRLASDAHVLRLADQRLRSYPDRRGVKADTFVAFGGTSTLLRLLLVLLLLHNHFRMDLILHARPMQIFKRIICTRYLANCSILFSTLFVKVKAFLNCIKQICQRLDLTFHVDTLQRKTVVYIFLVLLSLLKNIAVIN